MAFIYEASTRVQVYMLIKIGLRLGMVAHTCNPSTQEADARESRVPGQTELCRGTLSQKTKVMHVAQWRSFA
jgi:hypothetical protein